MAYSLSNKYAKNLHKRTVLVQLMLIFSDFVIMNSTCGRGNVCYEVDMLCHMTLQY